MVYFYSGVDTEGSNPCKGIKRYRREGRERFLSAAETRSLAAVLDRFEADRPQQAAIIRLLLLTGCRASEVRTLKWRYRREGKLFLPDSKTGPRTVWLSSAARAILDRVPRTASWMFPSPRTNGPLSHNGLDETWRRIRDEADLRDVRLHDLRHTCASWPDFLAAKKVIKRCNWISFSPISETSRYRHLQSEII